LRTAGLDGGEVHKVLWNLYSSVEYGFLLIV